MDRLLLSLRRKLWDAQRFGLTPGKLLERFGSADLPRVVCISLPKAGTHLLERAVCRVPGISRKVLPTVHDSNIQRWGGLESVLSGLRGGQVVVAHLSFSEERLDTIQAHQARGFFVIRDPRDIVVSQATYIISKKDHPQHAVFAAEPDHVARVLRAIRGNPATGLDSMGVRLRRYAGWLESELLTVRFEDLIGERGRGDAASQARLISAIAAQLGVEASRAQISELQRGLFSSASPTFSRGQAGGWREVFDERLIAAFNEEAGAELARYGYR